MAAQSRFTDTQSGTWGSCSVEHARSFGGEGYEVRYLYTKQQVRAMLATGWHHRKPNCITCNDHGEVGNILTAEPCPDCTPPQAQAAARDALEEAASVLSSINKGASHEVQVGDEVCYWQRKEWIEWAEKEVLPKVRAAIDAARAAQRGV